MRLDEIEKSYLSKFYTRISPIDVLNNESSIQMALSKADKNIFLYRGMRDIGIDFSKTFNDEGGLNMKDKSCLLFNPEGMVRVSSESQNWANLLVDSSKYWKDFPKRSNSLIVTNDIVNAETYNRSVYGPYVVLPIDDPIMAVSPGGDFWLGFRNIEIDDFNRLLAQDYTRVYNTASYLNLSQNDAYLLREQLLDMQVMARRRVVAGELRTDDLYFGKALIHKYPFTDYIDEILSPKSNGFSASQFSKFKSKIPKELWFSGKAILLRTDVFKKLFG